MSKSPFRDWEKFEDDLDAWRERRALIEAREGWLIDSAFRDLLAGKFDTEAVREALKLGHHDEYQKLREQYELAERVARASR
jgi:hypothetical protein